MATNKTLAPTNVTVQIPALADVPDMSVPANAIDKTIDAVNVLNSQLTSLLVYERHELTFGQCSPNTDYTQTKDVSKTGYSILGVVDFTIAGTYGTHFHTSEMTIVNYTNLRVKIRANSSLSFTTDNTKVSALVLYKKIIS